MIHSCFKCEVPAGVVCLSLTTFAKGAGIAVAALRAVLLQRAKPIEDLFVSRKPPDSHLTGEGYRLLAAAVVEAIRGGGLLR